MGGRQGGFMKFRMFGFPVEIPMSGLLGVALIAFLWMPAFVSDGAPAPLLAVVFAVALYACILIHELAHALVAKAVGHPVTGITLWILGGYTVFERKTARPLTEAAISISGPLTTLAIAGSCYLGERLLLGTTGAWASVAAILGALGWTNALLGIVNLLPGLPLDGGGALKALGWALTGSETRGTVIAAWSGRIIAAACLVVPVLLAIRGGQINLGLMLPLLLFGSFVWSGASQALRTAEVESRIPDLDVLRLVRPCLMVSAQQPLSVTIDRAHELGMESIVVVAADGRPTGVVDVYAAASVPLERRPWVSAADVARSLQEGQVLDSHLSAQELMDAVRAHQHQSYVVVDGNAVRGVVELSDVLDVLGGRRNG